MNWSPAFARQAVSDLDARETLIADRSLPSCHALHYLQMACEKVCKAAMIAGGVDPNEVKRSHAHISNQLPTLVKLHMSRRARRIPRDNWIVRAARPLARKIELLSPSVGDSPQNCEYPWKSADGSIIPPADYNFEFDALFERAGITTLKVVREIAIELQK
jgi:hypothetical protein